MSIETHIWSEPPDGLILIPETVDVWLFPLRQSPIMLEQMHNILSSDEKLKASRLKSTIRNHFIVSRGTTRTLLGQYLNDDPARLIFKRDAHGKPRLDTHSSPLTEELLHFNLSHSHEYGLLAVSSDRAVGVDLEYNHRRVKYMAIAKRFFTPGEFKTLQNTPQKLQIKAFFAGWCRKEAVLKAIGTGIAGGLNQIEVSMTPETLTEIIERPKQLLSDSANHSTSQLCIQQLPAIDLYTHAVAAAGIGWALRCFRWNDLLIKKPC